MRAHSYSCVYSLEIEIRCLIHNMHIVCIDVLADAILIARDEMSKQTE